MKLAIAGLTFLGLVAAVCAALLVGALKGGSTRPGLSAHDGDSEVGVIVAAVPIPASTVVEAKNVKTQMMARSRAPANCLTNPIEVVGKVLAKPMLEEEAFTNASFVTDNVGTHLAALLPRGSRAMGISVTDYAGLEGLLYPGCLVDVLVSFKPGEGSGGRTRRGAISKVLLEGVTVLAIEKQTIGGADVEKAGAAMESNRANNARRVTLQVDTKQASALSLAIEQGTLSLALRNPLDVVPGDQATVSLHSLVGDDGEGPTGDDNKAWELALLSAMNKGDKAQTGRPADPWGPPGSNKGPHTRPSEMGADATPEWEIDILRAGDRETRTFPMEEALKKAGQ